MSNICRSCGGSWAWTGRLWLVSDMYGRLLKPQDGILVEGKPEPLARCPVCGALQAAGKASVREEQG